MKRNEKAFRDDDARALREVAKEYIYRAVETGDKLLAYLAVIAYALSKLISKIHFRTSPHWPEFRKAILDALERELPPERIAGMIASLDEDMGNYVHSIIDKARVKMASDAYAAGLSLRAAADLTGADVNELIDYVGKTTIHDEEESKISLSDRVNALRRLLG
jgi:hypothetical protein